MGIVVAFGSAFPLVVFHPEDIATAKGLLVLAGLFVVLSGITMSARAGILRERDLSSRTDSEKTDPASGIPAMLGVIICILSGLTGGLPNVAFVLSEELLDLTVASGAPTEWAANSVWVLMFSVGMVPNVAYCGYLMKKNRTFRNYITGGQFRNLILVSCMAILWLGSQHLYGVGARIMGDWGSVIGWGVICTFTIATGNVSGFVLGEWKGTSRKSRAVMFTGLGCLFLGIILFTISSGI
jgi:L-rhamnose-H+ transport protein